VIYFRVAINLCGCASSSQSCCGCNGAPSSESIETKIRYFAPGESLSRSVTRRSMSHLALTVQGAAMAVVAGRQMNGAAAGSSGTRPRQVPLPPTSHSATSRVRDEGASRKRHFWPCRPRQEGASPLLPSKHTGAIHHALLWDSGIQVFQLLFIRNKYTLFYCLGQRGNAGRKDAVQRDAVREDRRATRHCIIDENIV
jgi:hypothetical protein